MVGGGDFSQFPLSKIDGLEEVPETLVARLVQLGRVNLQQGRRGGCHDTLQMSPTGWCDRYTYLQNSGLEELSLCL